MKIKSINRNSRVETVYDIETPTHDYILSNGVISHNTQEMFSKPILSGGTGIMLASDNVWLVGRSQDKEGTDLTGYNFTIRIEKSRYVREKSAIPITVKFEGGMSKYTGLLEMSLESKAVIKPSNGWFSRVDDDGVVEDKKFRAKDIDNREFWEPVLKTKRFKDYLDVTYKVSNGAILSDAEIDAALVGEDE